jgi:GNAT superfamily N-acetyltransferase
MTTPTGHGAPTPTIRAAVLADADELSRLFTALEHPTRAAEITARWAQWAAEGNDALVADRGDGTLAGLATLHRTRVLHRPAPVGRITALVVDAAERGRGIGRALVAAAEERLTRDGCILLEITSNLRRADAHAFYERIGYARTSVRLARTLPIIPTRGDA